MVSWQRIETESPELAARVRAHFDAGRDKVIATLRADGSPRVSGIELVFLDGDVQFGMMADSVKLADVRRDPRVAIHSPTLVRSGETAGWDGDAKLAGRALEWTDRVDLDNPGAAQLRLDVEEVVVTGVDGESQRLVIESWRPGSGYRRRERD